MDVFDWDVITQTWWSGYAFGFLTGAVAAAIALLIFAELSEMRADRSEEVTQTSPWPPAVKTPRRYGSHHATDDCVSDPQHRTVSASDSGDGRGSPEAPRHTESGKVVRL